MPARSTSVRSTSTRSILLLDCDAFFVQVARQIDPEGAGNAERLLVGGHSGRGVVTSASYEARAFGARSGMPMMEALRLCPDAVVVPVPRDACVDRSRAIREELETLAPVVEAASIDEFYLDLTGTERLFDGETLARTAARIRERVLVATGILVSIGGGSNRLVAKLAAGRAKPGRGGAGAAGDHRAEGVLIVPPGAEADFLAGFALVEIPGVGPSLADALADRQIRTVPDLLTVEPRWLERWVGAGRAGWLRSRALGIDDAPVTPERERKSISSERTFFDDIPTGPDGDAELERQLLKLVLSIGPTLRSKHLRARTVTVRLRDSDFTTRQRSLTPAGGAIESDRAIYEIGRELLVDLRARRKKPSRLLGIGVSGLVDADAGGERDDVVQFDLLGESVETIGAAESAESERDRALSRIADELRARFGDDAIRPGRVVKKVVDEE